MWSDNLTEKHTEFRNAIRELAAREITPHVRKWEAAGGAPRELWRLLGREGFLCPWMPREYGGRGLGYEYSVIIGEELVRADAFGTGIPLHSDVVSPYIYLYGSPEIKQRWLPLCRTGRAVCAIAMTEPGAGSDLSAIRTNAVREGDQYLINGQKTFITNGHSADLIVLAVKTDSQAGFFGTSLLLVEGNAPGLSRGRRLEKMGCHLQDTAELFFEDCRVPSVNLLGQEGMGARYLMERLPEERLEVAVKCQALAEDILKETLQYVKTRRVSGRPVGNFQHNTFKLAEMATEVEVGRDFLDAVITRYLAGRDIGPKATMAKYWLAEMVNRLAWQAVQLHGGYGLLEENRVCRMYRDARVVSVYAGTSEVMKMLIGRQLGLRPR